ncbi:integrase core domain-containing protein [Burkholderia diffusa]|uniref:integrase core domain-containing protein n=1 Tax=Burkholderia diffusa TaxID=488732 RepID=UPI00158AD5EC
MLTIIDMWNRACRHIEVDFSLTGVRVTRVLEQSRQRARRPNLIQVDNGPEFVSRALDAWAHEHGVKPQFIRPGKPVENAHIESFNGRLREECLNQHAFVSLDDVRRRIEAWRATTTRCVRIVRWGNWRRTNSGNCINRKPARPLTYERCTRRGKVTSDSRVTSDFLGLHSPACPREIDVLIFHEIWR